MTVLHVSTFEIPPRGSWGPFTPHNSRHTYTHSHTSDTSGVNGASSCCHGVGGGGGVSETWKKAKGSQRSRGVEIFDGGNRGDQSKGGGNDQSSSV